MCLVTCRKCARLNSSSSCFNRSTRITVFLLFYTNRITNSHNIILNDDEWFIYKWDNCALFKCHSHNHSHYSKLIKICSYYTKVWLCACVCRLYPLIVVHNFLLPFVATMPGCHLLREKRIENMNIAVHSQDHSTACHSIQWKTI